jgi:hypothetical protein
MAYYDLVTGLFFDKYIMGKANFTAIWVTYFINYFNTLAPAGYLHGCQRSSGLY